MVAMSKTLSLKLMLLTLFAWVHTLIECTTIYSRENFLSDSERLKTLVL